MMKWFLAVLALGFAAPSFGQESGTLTGTLDGQEVSFDLVAMQTDHRGNPNFGSVSMAYRIDIDESDLKLFFVGFNLVDGDAETPEVRLSISMAENFVAREDDFFSVTVDEASKQGEMLLLKGTLSLNAYFSDDFGRTLDSSRSHVFEGAFEAIVGGI